MFGKSFVRLTLRRWHDLARMNGYFEIGIYRTKAEVNVGTLWRSAYQLGAAGIFTIGKRYKRDAGDTTKAWRHIPLRHYETFEQFQGQIPFECLLVGIEMGGIPLCQYKHPKRAIYLLGAEDDGLPEEITKICQQLISLEASRTLSFNVAVAGSIVMYHRQFGLGQP